jgi:molybdate transport system ATP-binding protein
MTERTDGLQVRLTQSGPIPLQAELDCAPGELLALLGPSGSGKSTILRAIAGLYRARAGSVAADHAVWFDAARGIDRPPQAREVGLVFQHYALFPHLSALENLTVCLTGLARGEREAKARELLAAVHLQGLEDRRPSQLSGGQQQRVAVARALARGPRVLLLDEPFSAVDRETRKKLQRELVQLRRRLSIPVILVTHDLEEARALADRLVVLQRGATLRAGLPEEVLARPGSATVARLLGHTNLFEGRVREHQPERGVTLLEALGHVLEARHQPAFDPGATVSWLIPSGEVILHRRDRPSRGERENPVSGVVAEFLPLGEMSAITLVPDGAPGLPLAFSAPTHVARRNGIAAGVHATVSLLAEGIHLMPPADAG